MPSEMTKNVRLWISEIVSKQMEGNGDVAIDILRSIQEESSLLLERQRILDTFDTDPFGICDDNEVIFDIIKNSLRVTSCSRYSTMSGHSHTHVIIQLQHSTTKSDDDDDFIQLEFSFERTPTNKGTNVVYTIWLSHNYGPKEIFINIEVIASGDTPSTQKAISMFESDDDEEVCTDVIVSDDECEKMDESSSTTNVTKTNNNNNNSPLEDGKDYYNAFVNPSILTDWHTTWKSKSDDVATLYLLMTFPFYENEWDIVGFLMDTCFDPMDDDSDENDSHTDHS